MRIESLLAQIARLDGPHKFLELLIRDAEVRTLRFLDAIRAAARERGATSVLKSAAKLLEDTHAIVENSRTLADISALAALGRKYHLVLSAYYIRVLKAFDEPALRSAIQIREDATRLVGKINELTADSIGAAPDELLSDGILAWISVLSTASDLTDAQIEGAQTKLEMLEYTARARRTETPVPLRGRQSGFVRITTPLPQIVSENWFALGEQFVRDSRELTDLFFAGSIDWSEAVRRALLRSDIRLHSEQSSFAFIGFAMLRNSLIGASSSQINKSLIQFRSLLDQAPMGALLSKERATYRLRYALAVHPFIAALPDRRNTLVDVVDILSHAIEETSALENPGLMRDALMSRARARRELSAWDGAQLDLAIADFRAGLDIPGARYARDARGRGLGDLASALEALPNRTSDLDDEIDRLMSEAISWCVGFPRNHVIALRSRAVFFNERVRGDVGENQEKALYYINMAVAGLEAVSSYGLEPVVRELRAVVRQTRGNVLLARRNGDRESNVNDAISEFQSAFAALEYESFSELRADLRFSLAAAYGQLRDGEGIHAAQRNLEEARRLARTPLQRARISRAETELWLESSEQVEVELPARIAAAEASLGVFEVHGNIEDRARAQASLGELLTVQPTVITLERAAALFSRAAQLFAQAGDLHRSAAASEALGSVRLTQWRSTPGGRDLLIGASEALAAAIANLDLLRRSTVDPIARADLSERVGFLRTERLWMAAQLGATAAQLHALGLERNNLELETARALRGVQRRLTRDASADIVLADRLLGIARADYVRGRAEVSGGVDLSGRLEAIRRAQQDLLQALAEAGEGEPQIELSSPNSEGETRLEFHVAERGSVVLCSGPGLPTEGLVRLADFSMVDLIELMGGSDGWFAAYERRKTAPQEWENVWRGVLESVRTNILMPLNSVLDFSEANRKITLLPGALSLIPLHAVWEAPGVSMLGQIASVVTTNVSRRRVRHGARSSLRRAVCVLSDPASGGTRKLAAAVREIADVSALLVAAGVRTEVIASSGTAVGAEVFDRECVSLDSGVTVVRGRPTPSWFQENISGYDFILFSGHATGGPPEQSGLVLVDQQGSPAVALISEMWGSEPLLFNPIVVLSACETAMDTLHVFSESESIAACMLRLGASHVIGTMWAVADDMARAYSTAFVRELLATGEAGRAHVRALVFLRSLDTRVTRWAPFTCWST